MIKILFWSICIMSCCYSFIAGHKEGMIASILIFLASSLTYFFHNHQIWYFVQLDIFLIDSVLLAGIYILALTSNKNWLIWMCGFQLVSVASHISVKFDTSITPRAYELLQGFWSIPVMLTMALGIFMNRTIHEKSKRRWVGVNK